MSEQKEIFITSATLKRPDGTIEQLSEEEAQRVMHGHEGTYTGLPSGDVTIEWIEATPEQFLAMHGIVI